MLYRKQRLVVAATDMLRASATLRRKRHRSQTNSSRRLNCVMLFATASASSLGWASSAFAQQAAAANGDAGGTTSGTQLQEIVVTAQKRSENLQNVPIAITAVTGETLAKASINSTADLARLAPNVVINTQGVIQTYIRGLGVDFANLGLETSNALYLDDMYLSAPSGGILRISDIERIEVLKGPQGTLYGRNTTGGAIRIITKDPGSEPEARLSLATGSFHLREGEAMVSEPLGDAAGIRASLYYTDNDGYVRNIVDGEKLNGNKTIIPRITLKAKPTDRLTLRLKLDYVSQTDSFAAQDDDPAPYSVGVLLGGKQPTGFYTSTQNELPKGKRHQFGVMARADYDADNFVLSSISGYRSNYFSTFSDVDTTNLPFYNFNFYERRKSYQQEFQAVSKSTGPLTGVAGLYFFTENGSSRAIVFGPALRGQGLDVSTRVKVTTLAPYAELTYHFTNQLSLTGGARYTYEKKRFDGATFNNSFNGAPLPTPALQPFDVTFNHFTPKLTLSYKPSENILAYATYAKGFKSGGFVTPAFSQPINVVKPELITDYEVGLKTQFGRVRWNTTAFYYDYKDLQVQVRSLTGTTTSVENAAAARLYGLESDLSVALASELTLNSGIGLLHTKYTSYPQASVLLPNPKGGYAAASSDLTGVPLPRSPKLTAYTSLDYKHQLANIGSIEGNVLANYSSRYFFDATQIKPQPKMLLVSGSLTWTDRSDRYSVIFSGENLTDKKYYETRSIGATGAYYRAAAPRSWKVTLVAKY